MVKGIQGVVQMIAAIPGGWACDRFRRDTILKISSVLGIFCALLTVVAFYKVLSDCLFRFFHSQLLFVQGHLMLIYVAFGFWGIFCALQGPALEALFADSIPNGERSFPITIKHMLTNLAMVVGPGLCIVFFLVYGDSWNLGAFHLPIISLTYILKNSIYSVLLVLRNVRICLCHMYCPFS
jgi:MFS family permease